MPEADVYWDADGFPKFRDDEGTKGWTGSGTEREGVSAGEKEQGSSKSHSKRRAVAHWRIVPGTADGW